MDAAIAFPFFSPLTAFCYFPFRYYVTRSLAFIGFAYKPNYFKVAVLMCRVYCTALHHLIYSVVL